jgi:hypothetical protein
MHAFSKPPDASSPAILLCDLLFGRIEETVDKILTK